MDNEKIRIIIADDEPVTKMDLRELLTSAGYEVVAEASDGLDAVELCRQHRPDLILLATGAYVRTAAPVPAGSKVVVDCGARRTTVGGAPVAVTLGSDYFELDPPDRKSVV